MEELLGRQPPHSAPAEQAVIGAMLIDPSCIPDVIEKVKSDEFYIQVNRDIFDTIFAMFSYGQSVDAVTVLEQMKVRGVYKDTTQQYLMEVMQITPTAANVLKYAAIVRDQALLRNLHTAADEINTMIFEGSGGADAMLEAAERKIYALRQGRNVGGLQPISMVIQRVYANLSEAASSGGGIPGLATGLPDLDQTILGLNAGELILIAARPGMGKTSMALNIALHVGKTSGKTVAVFSLEMAREQLTTRLLAGEGLVDSQKLLTGKLSADEWRRVGAAATTISATDIRIDDNPSLSVADMNAQCRRIPNLGLVVIDYLQLMQSAGIKRYAQFFTLRAHECLVAVALHATQAVVEVRTADGKAALRTQLRHPVQEVHGVHPAGHGTQHARTVRNDINSHRRRTSSRWPRRTYTPAAT